MRRRWIYVVCLVVIISFIATGWSLLLLEQSKKQNLPVSCGQGDLIRLHVLANSDSVDDQQLKLKVRDAIIAYLAPYMEETPNATVARQIVLAQQANLMNVAKEVIAMNGASYPVNIEIGLFDFPIKSYGDLVLPAGKYEAVRILIGNGQGKNWWCVLFPPLCFIDITNAAAVPVTGTADNKESNQEPQTIEFKWKIVELLTDNKK